MENLRIFDNYKIENEEFYIKLNKDLDEIKSNLNYVLSEQEKQRIQNMTITELQTEMLRVLHEMRMDLDELLGRDK